MPPNFNLLHADKAFDAESAEWAIMTGCADNQRCVDSVGIHAALVVMVHSDQCPVSDNSSDADLAISCRTSDEIFNGGGIEKLDVRELENL
jgi:hypothetical protein